eukprot:CAMPEP_0201999514 /NCGR_PEP_ID=MMETSP0905-20130828/6081_1 /ASSEMBLY_ACC=CAM_ASM_000554 /TAXON_ID=420261 /ORGANISM="Thalassiosira antarctica, Strain CCMP982" /LENGTH=404 /DNA_ID=CAMNT_0048555765 /DNA_START=124 /DNA_END=1338 /DNA_ORIENTATION=+
MTFVLPTTTQMRALAYAPKPFAALSFLSSLFGMYYILIRHREKQKRMYHRLILSTFVCIMPLSFCLFLGTWAMPSGSVPWVVGNSGTSVTCSIQGFIWAICIMAFPFYYASLSIFAYVAVKNNYKEEKYVWMEKWIHVGAYLPPLTLAIVAAVKDWIRPGLAYCIIDIPGDCLTSIDPDCDHKNATKIYSPIAAIVLIELMVGTFTIIYLLCTFDKIQKEVEVAIGMKQIVEKARKRRLQEVSLQTGLYLMSFWFGYIPRIVEDFVRTATGELNYDLITAVHCIFANQGFIFLVIYFTLQQRSQKETVPVAEINTTYETVSKIRANAARRKSSSRESSLANRFSFHVFDGTPTEDSPWRAYFDDDSDEQDLSATVIEEEESIAHTENSLVTSLLADSPLSHDIP